MKAPQKPRRREQAFLSSSSGGPWRRIARLPPWARSQDVALDEGEDLMTHILGPADPWGAVEADSLKMAQEGVHRRSPRTGRAVDSSI